MGSLFHFDLKANCGFKPSSTQWSPLTKGTGASGSVSQSAPCSAAAQLLPPRVTRSTVYSHRWPSAVTRTMPTSTAVAAVNERAARLLGAAAGPGFDAESAAGCPRSQAECACICCKLAVMSIHRRAAAGGLVITFLSMAAAAKDSTNGSQARCEQLCVLDLMQSLH